jgi:hypothetical protein
MKSLKQDTMVDRIESGVEIEQRENCYVARVDRHQTVGKYSKQSGIF